LGEDHLPERLPPGEPERARGRLLARVHRVDPRPVDLGDVRAVHEHERDDPPERRRRRDARDLQRGRAEPEERNHEDRWHTAEEVGVHDRESPQREEDRPREAPQHREQEREREDEALRDREDLAVEEEGSRDLREGRPELRPVEERAADLVPAGRVGDGHAHDDEEDDRREKRDRDAPAALHARTQRAEDARAPRLVYFKTGAPVAFASHCCWICCSAPFARSFASALSTHAASGLPLAKTMPKYPAPPP